MCFDANTYLLKHCQLRIYRVLSRTGLAHSFMRMASMAGVHSEFRRCGCLIGNRKPSCAITRIGISLHRTRSIDFGAHNALKRCQDPLVGFVVRALTDKGKTGKIDNVQKAYERLCKNLEIDKAKPLKLLRKTSASVLETHENYGRHSQYFLGHAPSSVAEKQYARPSKEVFDKAVKWLGKQYGLKV